ncbi:hypothetical protein K402DRAFT_424293 [Aulographum hederae CBS 113979]|uniref:Uncharacterized protein n=1 Tax=Aulographum hederae CBS 113979 TaxID=1176131 RepID=A0A6G1GPN6_9PEZI|nr:hypothetical protein K402DRAFT_424293 [Aulographum hederae CBS 113979]
MTAFTLNSFAIIAVILLVTVASTSTPQKSLVAVSHVKALGVQQSQQIPNIYRDGGYSVLLNGKVIWLYDDTQINVEEGDGIISFFSNSAAFSADPNRDILAVDDADSAHANATGGWIPFTESELAFNREYDGSVRVAIWPGTNPTPINESTAFLFAPIVYVDPKLRHEKTMFSYRGMALINIQASADGPVAIRKLKKGRGKVIPESFVAYGGFASIIGSPSVASSDDGQVSGEPDVYLFGMDAHGLQLARVPLSQIGEVDRFHYYHSSHSRFTDRPHAPQSKEHSDVYLAGTFSSGAIFFSPCYHTFLLVYFNKIADSTFWIRYLDLEAPISPSTIWRKGGKNGEGIRAVDAEALVMYRWSEQQILYRSVPEENFNYAGQVHPEFFNREYYSSALFQGGSGGKSPWLGAGEVSEEGTQDGKHLLLSWTAVTHEGYVIKLARVEFEDLPGSEGNGTETGGNENHGSPSKGSKVSSLKLLLTNLG